LSHHAPLRSSYLVQGMLMCRFARGRRRPTRFPPEEERFNLEEIGYSIRANREWWVSSTGISENEHACSVALGIRTGMVFVGIYGLKQPLHIVASHSRSMQLKRRWDSVLHYMQGTCHDWGPD
jgi:hypothetical protein